MKVGTTFYWPIESGVPGIDQTIKTVLSGRLISHDYNVAALSVDRQGYSQYVGIVFRSFDTIYETEAKALEAKVVHNQ